MGFKQTNLIVLILALLATVLTTRTTAADYFILTDMGTSAHTISVGGIEGFGQSATAVFENPAALYSIQKGGIAAFTTKLIDEVNYNVLALTSVTPFGTFGVGYMEANVTDIPETDIIGPNERFYIVDFFDYKNFIFKGSYQNSILPNMYVGGSLIYYSQAFADVVGRGFNLETGIFFDLDDLQISAAARNIIGSLDVQYEGGETEDLPFQFTTGLKYRYADLDLMLQVRELSNKGLVAVGVSYSPSFLPFMAINAGYKEFPVLDSVKSNVAFGIGLYLEGLKFHYAYEKSEHIEYDNHNYFSLSYNF